MIRAYAGLARGPIKTRRSAQIGGAKHVSKKEKKASLRVKKGGIKLIFYMWKKEELSCFFACEKGGIKLIFFTELY